MYFWTKALQNSSITHHWRVGYQTVGIVSSFLRETKSRLDPFFSACVPFSWLSGTCHMKTMARTRWKTHKPTYANPSFSQWLLALSCTLSKLRYIAFKNSYLDMQGSNPCTLLAATTVRPSTGCKVPEFNLFTHQFLIYHMQLTHTGQIKALLWLLTLSCKHLNWVIKIKADWHI